MQVAPSKIPGRNDPGRQVPEEYMLQIQTGLLVTGREWLDFVSYCAGLPMFVKRVFPDAALSGRHHRSGDWFRAIACRIAQEKYAAGSIGSRLSSTQSGQSRRKSHARPVRQTIAPKSDQLNADDLIGGPRTITITGSQAGCRGSAGSHQLLKTTKGSHGSRVNPCAAYSSRPGAQTAQSTPAAR
jgi:hypothetical protein